MKRIRVGLFCVFLLVQINNCFAQNFDIIEPSTEILETVYDNRSIGMGKTAITTANSSSAIFSNPSVLGTFTDGNIQIGGKGLYGTITNEARNQSDLYESYEESYPPFPNRSFVGLAFPYEYDNRIKLVFGVGYQRNEGVKYEVEAIQLEDRWSETRGTTVKTRITTTGTARSRGYLSTFVPGVAFNYDDNFYLGITLNRTFGAILGNWETKSTDENVEWEVEREQSAFFFKIGTLVDVTPELSIGLTYRPEFEWELGETITKFQEDGELDTVRDQDIDELTIPGMWGIGAKYKLSPAVVIAVELQSRPYGDLQWRGNIDNQDIIDDGYNVSIGAEFLELGFPVRVGAFREVVPFTDEDDTEPVGLIGLTAGIGSPAGQDFSWDASVLWSRWERTINDDGQKYTEDLIRVGVSGTFHFKTF